MPDGGPYVFPSPIALWHLNFKINTDERSFQSSFKVAEKTEVDAKIVGLKIATLIKAMMTSDCEIFYASMSRDDHRRDSRFLESALGNGTFEPGPPTEGAVNYSRDGHLFRLESQDGTSVTMKFAPMPDSQIVAGQFLVKPAAVVGMPGALPADPIPLEAYAVIVNKFYQALVFGTHHVKSGHLPGGLYTYDPWINCYPLRIGAKKGGRVFF